MAVLNPTRSSPEHISGLPTRPGALRIPQSTISTRRKVNSTATAFSHLCLFPRTRTLDCQSRDHQRYHHTHEIEPEEDGQHSSPTTTSLSSSLSFARHFSDSFDVGVLERRLFPAAVKSRSVAWDR